MGCCWPRRHYAGSGYHRSAPRKRELPACLVLDKDPKAALAAIRGFAVKELEYTSFAGEAVYLATNFEGDTRVIPVHGEAATAFDTDQVMRVVRDAAGSKLAELRLVDEFDAYIWIGGASGRCRSSMRV